MVLATFTTYVELDVYDSFMDWSLLLIAVHLLMLSLGVLADMKASWWCV